MCAFQHSQCDSIKTKTATSVGAVAEQCSLSVVLCLKVHGIILMINLDQRIMDSVKKKQEGMIRLSRILMNTVGEVLLAPA